MSETAENSPEQRRPVPKGRPFAPGQSGNPGGRPAVSKRIREIAQQHGEEAIQGLLDLARDPEEPGAVRKAAWDSILDRGFGRPTVGEPDDDGRQVSEVVYRWAEGGADGT